MTYSGKRGLQDDLAWLRDVSIEADDSDEGTCSQINQIALRLLACPHEQVESVLFWQAFEDFRAFVNLPPFSEQAVKDMLDCFVPEYHGGKSPLQLLAVAYAFCVSWHVNQTDTNRDSSNDSIGDSLDLVTAGLFKQRQLFLENTIMIAIPSGMNSHEVYPCHTPLYLFLSAARATLQQSLCDLAGPSEFIPRRLLRKCLMIWLETLQNAGVDLVTYGAEECHIFELYRSSENPVPALQHWHEMDSHDDKNALSNAIYNFTFTYGPTPADWTVELDVPVERYMCDFWQMPGLHDEWMAKAMPGSWIGD